MVWSGFLPPRRGRPIRPGKPWVTCLRPVMAGTKVRVETKLISIGRTMGNVRGEIKTMDGKVCFACVHDKYIIPSAPKL